MTASQVRYLLLHVQDVQYATTLPPLREVQRYVFSPLRCHVLPADWELTTHRELRRDVQYELTAYVRVPSLRSPFSRLE